MFALVCFSTFVERARPGDAKYAHCFGILLGLSGCALGVGGGPAEVEDFASTLPLASLCLRRLRFTSPLFPSLP